MGPLDHAVTIGAHLRRLEAPWALGGSLASSLMGEPRSTNDIDIALRIEPDRIVDLVSVVDDEYYAPRSALEDAAQRFSSFNLLHLGSSFKVDLFFLGDSQLDRWQIERRQLVPIPGADEEIWVTSAADLILRKLWWFRLGNEVSDRQWSDVLALLRVQRCHLDVGRLETEAAQVGLGDLLSRAIDQSA